MRKLAYLAAAGLLLAPAVTQAKPLDELLADKGMISGAHGGAKLYYKKGLRMEFPDKGVALRSNVQLQTRYSYHSYDDSEARGLQDASDFEVKRARLDLRGEVLDGDVDFRLQNDFVGDKGGNGKRDSDLKDAWIRFNLDDAARVKFGQFKAPYGRQKLASSTKLQFIDRSIVTDSFTTSRNQGVSLGGDLGDGIGYTLAVFNGLSDGEGSNKGGVDTNMFGAGQLFVTCGNYGSRGEEGDWQNTEEMGGTAGIAVRYDEANDDAGGQVDTVGLNADVGVRYRGFSAQGEFFYENVDVEGASDELDDYGFYVQAGMFPVPQEIEVAGRFGWIEPDDSIESSSGVDSIQEYTVVINYYLDGHNLKAQTGVTFEVLDNISGDDVDDLRYDLQLSGYF